MKTADRLSAAILALGEYDAEDDPVVKAERAADFMEKHAYFLMQQGERAGELILKNGILAGRVDELERAANKWSYQYDELAARTNLVDKQNARYKQALEEIIEIRNRTHEDAPAEEMYKVAIKELEGDKDA